VGKGLPDDRTLSRADLAHFLLNESGGAPYRRRTVALSD
jgi:hypothetical protein